MYRSYFEMDLLETDGKENDIGGGIRIKVDDLRVWTPEEKSWWRRKAVKPKTIILNNVTGCIKHGEFVAILGPSGAGKTTFLVSLAGKCTLPSQGIITVNGVNVKDLPRGVVEIVPQFEVFMNSLSVMEHLVFMTEMKLGSYKKPINRMVLDALISDLKLKAHVSTSIGALSGGERRLLSLATSLLSCPQIMLCDEPTTGLDSYNALQIVGILKKLAQCGQIVICSVHQPSSDLFKEFNSIMLMAEGKLLFHGSQNECKDLFESINLKCPKNYNPAEFYIRAISSNPISGDDNNYVERILETYRYRSHERLESNPETSMIIATKFNLLKRNWFKQIYLLAWRSSLTLKRDIRDHIFQLFVYMMMSSLIITTCYIGISGTTQRGVQDFRGFLWLLNSEICFGLAYNALYVFEDDLTLFRREVGTYSASAFFVSRFMTYIPRCIIWPVTFVSIATIAVQLPNRVLTAIKFIVALIYTAIASVAFGLSMGAMFTSTGIMGDVMPCMDLPLFLMSGAFLRLSTIPVWLYPVRFISHFYYGMDAVSNIYWRQIDHIDCPSNFTTGCLKDGLAVLAENGYSNNFIFQDSLGLLFVTLLWSVLGYIGLKREEKKGYAY